MKSIDCRGLACPAPVLTTKEAIEKGNLDELTVIVDNEAARQNVSRFFESRNFEVSVHEEGKDFHVTGSRTKGITQGPLEDEGTDVREQKIMVMVASDRVGYGDDQLGLKLMAKISL